MTIMMRRIIIFLVAIVALGLIVGATRNLPTSAQGLVTGESDILIDRLADRVGEGVLIGAVMTSGALQDEQPDDGARIRGRNGSPTRDRARRGERNGRGGRNQGLQQIIGDLDDQLERLGPERIYRIAINAGLISEAEADRLLSQ